MENVHRFLLEVPAELYIEAGVIGFDKGLSVTTILLSWLYIGQHFDETDSSVLMEERPKVEQKG